MGRTGINLENVRIRNKSAILSLLNSQGAMSRKDIAKVVGLTPAAVTLLCTEMMEEGMILEKGELQEEKRAGRKKVLVDINDAYKCVIAVNMETVYTWITISNLQGMALAYKKIGTNTRIEPERFLNEIAKESKVLLWENQKTQEDILGVGICITGIVDRKSGISIHAYGIWKEQVPVQKIMEELMHCPVIVENNVKAFAEGELTYGLGKTDNDLLFVKWGLGVGSAIVINNRIYEGKENRAAEIGHYIVEPDGIRCRCGRRGCLETRVSTKAIADKLKEAFSEEHTPSLYQLADGDVHGITEDLFCDWIEKHLGEEELRKEPVVKEILCSSIERMARAVVNVMTVLAPDKTVLYGTMLENHMIRKIFMSYCQKYDAGYTDANIKVSELSDRISFIGATAIVTKKYFFEQGM